MSKRNFGKVLFVVILFFIGNNCFSEKAIVLGGVLKFKIQEDLCIEFNKPVLYFSRKDGYTLDYTGKYKYKDYKKDFIVQFRLNSNVNDFIKENKKIKVKKIIGAVYGYGSSREEFFNKKYVNQFKKNKIIILYTYDDWACEYLWDLSHYLIQFPENSIYKECYILVNDVWLYNHKEVSGNQFLKVEELKKKNPEKAVLYNLLEEFIFSVEYIGPVNEDTKAQKNTAE